MLEKEETTFCVYGGMLRCVGKREPSKQKRADTQNSQVRAQNNGMRLPCQSMGSRAKTCVGLRPSWARKQKQKSQESRRGLLRPGEGLLRLGIVSHRRTSGDEGGFTPDLHGYYNNCLSYTSAWLFSVLSYDRCTSFALSFPS